MIYVIMPQFIVTDELVELAENAIKSFRCKDVFLISVDDAGEYKKADRADEVMELSDKVVTCKKNSGFAKACNKGFKFALKQAKEDDYIICANNDIIVHEKAISELIRPFEMFDNVAITGIFSTDSKKWEGRPLEEIDLGKMAEGGQLGDRMQDGGLWMSTAGVLKKIGLFDERFIRGGYEDVDLFIRARDTFGMKIIMSSCAVYWHKQGATRWNTEQNGIMNDFGHESKRIEDENLKRFIDKWEYNPHQKQIWFNNEIFNR